MTPARQRASRGDARATTAVRGYAQRVHRLLGASQGVASALGAWLLLALVAEAGAPDERAALEQVLGLQVGEAATMARQLLDEPHPAVPARLALWRREDVDTESLRALLRAVTGVADTGPIPSQAEADAWAREHTRGLIRSFPLRLDDPDLLLVLASALVTTVDWRTPFRVSAPDALRLPVADPAFAGVPLLRIDGREAGHWLGILHRRYAAHAAWSTDGLVVVSVAGPGREQPGDVLDLAAEVAAALARDTGVPGLTPLAELPLGVGPAADDPLWRLDETPGTGHPERFRATLAAWEAASEHDLMTDATLGFTEALRPLARLAGPPEERIAVRARQSAVARYHRTGFEAAAVTTTAMRAAAAGRGEPVPVRTAELQFTRPYAVVAATCGSGPWGGIPVFSAWVTTPSPPQ